MPPQDDKVATRDVYGRAEYRPGVFQSVRLSNDLVEFPIWGGAAVPIPEDTAEVAGEAA